MTDHIQLTGTTWSFAVKRLSNNFLNFIFPPVCANCKKPGALICADCSKITPWLKEPICSHCGRVVSRSISRCPACLRHPLFPVQQVRAAVLFAEPIPHMIHQMKYNGAFAMAEPLADMMVQAWQQWHMPVDLVVGIPLHPDREKKRGYNQSDLLVAHFCQRLNLRGSRRALRRVRNTPPQVGLRMDDRQLNVANAFVADSVEVAGKNVLLVDDVCTTGNTLKASAQALLSAGAKRVSGYCLARAL